jgi:Spy/CpxP family protein refolding chaperone
MCVTGIANSNQEEDKKMQRTRSHWVAALVLGSTLLATVAARAADTPSSGQPTDRPHRMSRFQQALSLTGEQMQAIRDVHARHADSRKQLWQSLRQARLDLRKLALNGADAAAIQAKSAEVSQLWSQQVAMNVQTLQEISPILTPEQRDKLAQIGEGGHGHRRMHKQQQS